MYTFIERKEQRSKLFFKQKISLNFINSIEFNSILIEHFILNIRPDTQPKTGNVVPKLQNGGGASASAPAGLSKTSLAAKMEKMVFFLLIFLLKLQSNLNLLIIF